MGEDLRALANRYVQLSDDLEQVRRSILKALRPTGNGAIESNDSPFAQPARSSSSGMKKARSSNRSSAGSSQHPNAKKADEAAAQIVALLRSKPGMRAAEIARETASRPNTTVQRLERMRERGQVQRDDQGAYAASA